jgi:hypothetical protein
MLGEALLRRLHAVGARRKLRAVLALHPEGRRRSVELLGVEVLAAGGAVDVLVMVVIATAARTRGAALGLDGFSFAFRESWSAFHVL